MNYKQRILELCPLNVRCKSEDCTKLHPRILAGICILNLQNRCENGDQCQLLHKSRSDLTQLLKQSKINGVYSFNLCKNQKKCEDRECQYLHRDWAKNICLQEIEDECIDRNTCKLTHISWDKLRKDVYSLYNIHNLNPEDFKLGKDHSILATVCVDYLNGECPLQHSCLKEHVDWEYLRSKNVNQLQEFRRKPCTNFYSISQYSPEIQNETHMQFFEEIHNKLIRNDVKYSNVVDVLFILDCTGSMQRWLDSAKQNITKIIDEFRNHINSARTLVRTAFIGYRDFEDKENIFYREFTPNSQLIVDFIQHQQAYGGGDIPEDVVGALKKGLQLNFSRHPDSTLCTFLICDSPCHGPYHEYEDKYINSVKQGELENIMSKYEKLKKRSFFTCFKITDGTDIMFEKMKSGFKDLIISQSSAEGLKDAVVFSLKSSLYKSQHAPKTTSTSEKIRATYKKNSEQLFKDEIEGNYWESFQNKLEQSKVKGQTLLIVKKEFEELPTNEQGTQCVIFDLFDIANNRNLVVKLPKMVVQKHKKKQKLTDDEINEYELKIKTRYITLSLAQRLAYSYRQKTKQINGAPPLFYVSPILYELDEPFYGVKQIYGETRIDIPNSNEWTKFTNNANYVNSLHNYYATFSHFTYEETGNQFMITDLQGKLNILSDPAIQTINKDAIKVLHDNCNLEQKGINYFFQDQHKVCHRICQQLKLDNQKCNFINHSKGWDKQQEDSVYMVCDGCGDVGEQTYKQYLESNASFCENCQNENNDTIKLTCRCCKQKYDCAYNQCLRKNQIPEACDQCKLRCKFNDYHCYYCDCYCETRLTKLSIENRMYVFCSESIRYLRAIKCVRCSELYDFTELIDKNQYCNPHYFCKNCN